MCQVLSVNPPVGGYFSVPPRTVWIPCFLSRLVGSPVWDLGPGLVGCRLLGILTFWLAWSFALLVDTLEHGPSSMIDSSIYRTSARIRSRTLHPRIGAHQNGSTSVRFEGRVHAHHLPEDRESQADGIFEADYVDELEEKSTIVSDLKELVDCAAGVTSAISSCSSSGKSAERQFGDSGNKEFMACEERRSSASKIDIARQVRRTIVAGNAGRTKWRTRTSRRHPSSPSFSAERANRASSS